MRDKILYNTIEYKLPMPARVLFKLEATTPSIVDDGKCLIVLSKAYDRLLLTRISLSTKNTFTKTLENELRAPTCIFVKDERVLILDRHKREYLYLLYPFGEFDKINDKPYIPNYER